MARNLIVINVDFKETRVALIEDGVIAELQIERAAHRSTVGNIVLGRVTRVLPGMQAAFIDVGQERAAFLHVEDLIRPDDFDAYLAADARDEVKPKLAGHQADDDGEDADQQRPEAAVAADVDADAGQAGARRGRRRRGRRGRGRPGNGEGSLEPARASTMNGEASPDPALGSSADEDEASLADRGASAEADLDADEEFDVDATDSDVHASGGLDADLPGNLSADAPFGSADPGEKRHSSRPVHTSGDSSHHQRPGSVDQEAASDAVASRAPASLDDDDAESIDFEVPDAATEDGEEYEFDEDADYDEFAEEGEDDSADETAGEREDDEDELDDEDDEDLDDEDAPERDIDQDNDEDELDEDEDDLEDDADDLEDDADDLEDDEDELDDDELDEDADDLEDDADDLEDDVDDDVDDDDEGPLERGSAVRSSTAPEGPLNQDLPSYDLEVEEDEGVDTAEDDSLPAPGDDRPSHIQAVPPSEDEPPSSGERPSVVGAEAIPPVPTAARRGRSRRRSRAEDPAVDPGATEERPTLDVVSPEDGSGDGAGAEGDARRRRRRGRRRRGGRTEAVESEATNVDKAEIAVEAAEAGQADDPRRRRRRGRRRPGKPDVKVEAVEASPVKGASRRMPARVSRSVPISEVVREGNHVVVQISKEPIGTKGARVTSHVSLPGRYVVYLPTVEHVGISKRIGNARERARLRKTIEAIKPANGGLIVRTVAEGLTKKQLKADIGYLIKVWADVAKRRETAKASEILYEELDLVLKAARDLFTDEVQQIVIDDRDQHGRLSRFVEMFMPGRVKDIKLYNGDEPIFDAYGIEDEIKRALSRKVPLPSGGSLIMDQAEALTAIDVNTGRYVGKGSKDLEETAFKTNLEAVDEIAYQLRFRNIGGLVILDLIDMERAENREKVWRTLEHKLAKDKAKTTINRISDLGLIEMTRKRTRESLGRVMHEPCFYCDGTGHIQSRETIAYEILRQIRRDRMSMTGYSVRVLAHPAVVDFLKHEARDALVEAERRYMRRIELVPRQEYHIEQYDLQGR